MASSLSLGSIGPSLRSRLNFGLKSQSIVFPVRDGLDVSADA